MSFGLTFPSVTDSESKGDLIRSRSSSRASDSTIVLAFRPSPRSLSLSFLTTVLVPLPCAEEGACSEVANGMIDGRGQAEIILVDKRLRELLTVEQNTQRMEANNPLDILRRVKSFVKPINPNRNGDGAGQTDENQSEEQDRQSARFRAQWSLRHGGHVNRSGRAALQFKVAYPVADCVIRFLQAVDLWCQLRSSLKLGCG